MRRFCILFLFFVVGMRFSVADSALNQNTLSDRSYPKVLKEAEIAYVRGDFQKAYEFYKEALKNTDDNRLGYDNNTYWMGNCLIKLGRYKEARDVFQLLISQNKNKVLKGFGYFGLGESYLYENKFKKAKKAYAEVLQLEGNGFTDVRSMAYYRLGLISEALGHEGEAQKYFNFLHQKYPNSYSAIASKIVYFVQVGAFQNRENAQRLKEKLVKKKYPCHIEMVVNGGKRFYRVRIGSYRSIEDARIVLRQVREKEKIKATLIKESR